MKRRDFLTTAAAASLTPAWLTRRTWARHHQRADEQAGPGFATPADAIHAQRERLLYTVALYSGSAIKKPDYLATVDVDPESSSYGQVIHRVSMPYVGDELHHFGWNACSSCHFDPSRSRSHLVIPGLRSSRIHIVDTSNPRAPRISKIIEPEEIKRKTNLSSPHTVHCLGDGHLMISMLGDAEGNAPGGFLLLDDKFNVAGRWERTNRQMNFNYDFWYQPRHNVMVSSEWAAPKTFFGGFDLKDVEAGKYGSRLLFWDWKERRVLKTVPLGENGLIPLEIRFHHDPDSTHGFVGAALSSAIWHWYQDGDDWKVEKTVQVPSVELEGWPFPVPALITDLLISMDDRFLYFSNWLHGDLRQYDISDPSHPKLVGQIWCGGLLDRSKPLKGRKLLGGPQMLQLSLDGKRLYVTNSLLSSWDDQFYPDLAKQGSYLLQIDCNTDKGGLEINEDFYVDFGAEPNGPARAHEMRYPGGDCTSDIFV